MLGVGGVWVLWCVVVQVVQVLVLITCGSTILVRGCNMCWAGHRRYFFCAHMISMLQVGSACDLDELEVTIADSQRFYDLFEFDVDFSIFIGIGCDTIDISEFEVVCGTPGCNTMGISEFEVGNEVGTPDNDVSAGDMAIDKDDALKDFVNSAVATSIGSNIADDQVMADFAGGHPTAAVLEVIPRTVWTQDAVSPERVMCYGNRLCVSLVCAAMMGIFAFTGFSTCSSLSRWLPAVWLFVFWRRPGGVQMYYI